MRALLSASLLIFACEDGARPDAGSIDSGTRDSGLPEGYVEISTSTLDLGPIVLGTSHTKSFTVTNPAGRSLSVALTSPSGPDAERFERLVNIPEIDGVFRLEAGGTATIAVTATAESEGPIEGLLGLETCGGSCRYSVGLLGRGVRSGISCPEVLDFGLVNPGTCASLELTCANAGNTTELVTTFELDPASDPVFRLLAPALPSEVASKRALTAGVEYCPDGLGTNEGAIAVLTFSPFQTEHAIRLEGRGGGPDLSCTPASIDFGAVAVGANVAASILCTNGGSDVAEVTAMLEAGAEFSVAVPSLAIEPGTTETLSIVHAPASPGEKQDALHILSNDPDSSDLRIPLASRALMVDPCSAELVPGNLELGLIGVGDVRTGVLLVRNTGSSRCLIESAGLRPGSSPDVRIVDGPMLGEIIEPGATRPIRIEVTPRTNGAIDAGLIVAFTNPGTAELSARIEATAGIAPLALDPVAIRFERAPIGCAAPHQKAIVIRNVGGGSGRVLGVEIAGDASGAFSVDAAPRTLAFFETMEAIVSYDPPAAGIHSAELHVRTDASSTPMIVPIFGEAVAETTVNVSTVLSPRAIDLLFVIDDSRSMGPAQQALADALPIFDQIRIDRRADVRAAVITTDMEDPLRSGRFQGVPPVLDGSSPTFLQDLRNRLRAGIEGSGNEMGILALHRALTPPLIGAENAGFLRPNAALAIVIVTDENDFSPPSPAIPAVLAALQNAAGDRLIVTGIVGPANGGCSGPYGPGNESPRWAELIGRVQDNLHLSFCAPIDRTLAAIAEHIFGETAIALPGRPVINTIEVTIDGAVLPPSEWSYDRSTDRVVIHDPARAPIGALVSATYRSHCLSPTCGDGTIDAGEQCDDGTAACVDCNDAVCGDGVPRSDTEECDDGNLSDQDACLPGCIAARCGDGVVQLGVEACDDGNLIDGDGCPSTCRFHQLSGPTPATFVPLVNGATLTFSGGGDPYDDGSAIVILPFEIELFGNRTSTLTVSVNGFVSTSPVGPRSWINTGFPDPALPNGVIAPWWDDLYLDEAIAGGARIWWAVLGAAPDRTAVIEWTDVRQRAHDTANHRRFTFQVRFEEQGAIHFAYADTETAGTVPTIASASAGIEDPVAIRGIEALGCSPACDGRPRPLRADGFPAQSVVTFAP